MRPAMVTAVLLLVGVLTTVTTVHGIDTAKSVCDYLYQDEPCGDGWSRIDDDRCAKFFDSAKTFKDAQEHCRSFDSDLVSIHDITQSVNVNCIAIGDNVRYFQTFWMGGQRSGKVFTFIDGSEFDYDGWFYNEPHNHGGQENCLLSNGKTWGFWKDHDCMEENKFVCAKEM